MVSDFHKYGASLVTICLINRLICIINIRVFCNRIINTNSIQIICIVITLCTYCKFNSICTIIQPSE